MILINTLIVQAAESTLKTKKKKATYIEVDETGEVQEKSLEKFMEKSPKGSLSDISLDGWEVFGDEGDEERADKKPAQPLELAQVEPAQGILEPLSGPAAATELPTGKIIEIPENAEKIIEIPESKEPPLGSLDVLQSAITLRPGLEQIKKVLEDKSLLESTVTTRPLHEAPEVEEEFKEEVRRKRIILHMRMRFSPTSDPFKLTGEPLPLMLDAWQLKSQYPVSQEDIRARKRDEAREYYHYVWPSATSPIVSPFVGKKNEYVFRAHCGFSATDSDNKQASKREYTIPSHIIPNKEKTFLLPERKLSYFPAPHVAEVVKLCRAAIKQALKTRDGPLIREYLPFENTNFCSLRDVDQEAYVDQKLLQMAASLVLHLLSSGKISVDIQQYFFHYINRANMVRKHDLNDQFYQCYYPLNQPLIAYKIRPTQFVPKKQGESIPDYSDDNHPLAPQIHLVAQREFRELSKLTNEQMQKLMHSNLLCLESRFSEIPPEDTDRVRILFFPIAASLDHFLIEHLQAPSIPISHEDSCYKDLEAFMADKGPELCEALENAPGSPTAELLSFFVRSYLSDLSLFLTIKVFKELFSNIWEKSPDVFILLAQQWQKMPNFFTTSLHLNQIAFFPDPPFIELLGLKNKLPILDKEADFAPKNSLKRLEEVLVELNTNRNLTDEDILVAIQRSDPTFNARKELIQPIKSRKPKTIRPRS